MRLSGWKLPLERLSATSLSYAIQCPEKFRQRYVLKTPETFSGDAFIGSVFHDVVKEMDGDQDLLPMIDRIWTGIIDDRGDPEWRDAEPEAMFKKVKGMLKLYQPIAAQLNTVKQEERFEEVIGGVQVVGYIDRELTDRIIETKTSNAKQSKPKSHHRFQGQLYSLVSEKPVEWHYVTKQATPKVYTGIPIEGADLATDLFMPRANPDLTVMQIRFAVERLNDYYSRYGADQPWPMDGTFHDWLCSYCGFKGNCAAWA